MLDLIAKDFDEAWLRINRRFLGLDGDRPEDATRALMCYSFDNLVVLHGKPNITLDPGIVVNYHKSKWPHLLRTYMDWDQLKWLEERVKFRFNRSGDHSIPLGYSFKSSPKMNGSCLVGFTFLIDKNRNSININIHTRVAEVTRRMMMDMILFYKMFERLFGDLVIWDGYEWKIQMYYQMMYQSAMFVPILHTTFDFDKLGISINGRKHSGFIGRVEREIQVCMNVVSKGSGFAQMKKIRDLVSADIRGIDRKSMNINSLILTPRGKLDEDRNI